MDNNDLENYEKGKKDYNLYNDGNDDYDNYDDYVDYDDYDDYELFQNKIKENENEYILSTLFNNAKNINDYYEIINIESSIKIGKWTFKCYEKIMQILLKEKDENNLMKIIKKVSNYFLIKENNERLGLGNEIKKLLLECYKKIFEILSEKEDYIQLFNLIENFSNIIPTIESERVLEFLNNIVSLYETKKNILEIFLDYFKSNKLFFYHKYLIKKIKESLYLNFEEKNESIKENNIIIHKEPFFSLNKKYKEINSIIFLKNSFILISYTKYLVKQLFYLAIINSNLSLIKKQKVEHKIFFFYEINNNNILIRNDNKFCILNIDQNFQLDFKVVFSTALDNFDVILSKDKDIVIYNYFSIEIYLYNEKCINYYQIMNKEIMKTSDIYIHSLIIINNSYNKKIIISFQDKTKRPFKEKIQIINFYGLNVEKEISWEIPYYCKSRLIKLNDKYLFFNCCDYSNIININPLEIHKRIYGRFDVIFENYIIYREPTQGLTKENYIFFDRLPNLIKNNCYKMICNNGKVTTFKILDKLNFTKIFYHKDDKFMILNESIYKITEIYNNE